ncbi:MAG: response regulator [Solirubrobacterales bacterium]
MNTQTIDTQTDRKLRVVLADDSILLREGIARLLTDAGMDVVGQAGDGEDLLRKVRAHKPDVAVIDVRMPPTHATEGLEAAIELRSEMPEMGVLVLSQYVEVSSAMELFSDNAAGLGYLLKDRVRKIDNFVGAVASVAEGGSVLDPQLVSRLLGRHRDDNPLDQLAERELAVLALIAEGRSNGAISEHLSITQRAVERHITSIFEKLDLDAAPNDHRRVLAALKFLQER